MEENTHGAYFVPDHCTAWQRMLSRLYPTQSISIPEDLEGEGFTPIYIITNVNARLDWRDRLRVLVSGRLRVTTQTKTDVNFGRMVSQSVLYVLPPGVA